MKILTAAIVAFIFCNHALAADTEVMINQCRNAAIYIDVNNALMRDAFEWKDRQIEKRFDSSKDYLRRLNEINRLSNPMLSNGSMDRQKLKNWYQSPFCQNLVNDYQVHLYGDIGESESIFIKNNKNFDKAQLRQVYYYSGSMVGNVDNDVECSKFNEQRTFTYGYSATQDAHRKRLEQGLLQTLIDSRKNLRAYQVDLIKEMDLAKLKSVTEDINCQNGKNLSEQLVRLPYLKYSKRTQYLSVASSSEVSNNLCEGKSQFNCEALFTRDALTQAANLSLECDIDKKVGSQCDDDAETMQKKMLRDVQINWLINEKTKREKYIKDPVGSRLFNYANATGSIDNIAESCKQQAIKIGLAGAAYKIYASSVCDKGARQKFLKPQIEELSQINDRLKELDFHP